MGLLSKHKGAALKLDVVVQLKTISPWPLGKGPIAITWSRGKKAGQTSAKQPENGPSFATYTFNEALVVPATLYEDVSATKRGKSGLPSYERKELQLQVVRVAKGRLQGTPLGTVSLNLADYAGAASGRGVQQSLPVSCSRDVATAVAGPPKLLLAVACQPAGGSGTSELIASMSTEEAAEEAGMGGGSDAITSLSTDDEGGSSRASSRLGPASRPGSRAVEERLPSVPEVDAPGGCSATTGAAVAAAAAAALAAPAAEASGVHYDSDGFLIDASLDQEAPSHQQQQQQKLSRPAPDVMTADASSLAGLSAGPESSAAPTGSVRRNLGSALQHADSEAGASSEAAAGGEVQSKLLPAAAAGGAERELPPPQAPSPVAAAVLDAEAPAVAAAAAAGESSPEPWSTGQSSLSAGVDPAVPFIVQPSTQRRLARPEGQPGRRWAWRKDATAALPPGAPGSRFQQARLASAKGSARLEEAAAAAVAGADAADAAAGSAAAEVGAHATATSVEQSAVSAGSEASWLTSGRGSADLERAPAAGGAAALPAGRLAFVAAPPVVHARPPSADGAHPALRGAAGVRAGSLLVPSFSAGSSVDGAAQHGGQALLDALAKELRTAAALESAIYLAAGRKCFAAEAPTARALHAPARRLARTVISLGAPEGLPFALRAMHAIQVVWGAASGDLWRLAFWFANVQQLRWMLWACCQSEATLTAAATQAATGRAACGVGGNGGGEAVPPPSPQVQEGGWILHSLVPALRGVEGWLFEEMLRHLWWRVLLPEAGEAAGAAAALASQRSSSSQTEPSFSNGRPASGGSQSESLPSQVGSPRLVEANEEEAVQLWVEALGSACLALADPSRPGPAPRPQLFSLLRQLVVALLRRLDSLLFQKLLVVGEGSEVAPAWQSPAASPSRARGGAAAPAASAGPGSGGKAPALARLDSALRRRPFVAGPSEEVLQGLFNRVSLDPRLLPFQRGPLTFGTGVALKVAVSKLTHWAADVGVKEERLPPAGRSTEAADYRLFPCLRASADLLMMPKEVLADSSIRKEVVPGLPLRRVCQLLERFSPDEQAPDPLPAGLLEELAAEEGSPTSSAGTPQSPGEGFGGEAEGARERAGGAEDEAYQPASEGELLAQGLIEPVSLEMDDESVADLEEMEAAAAEAAERAGAAAGPAHGCALLRELWTAAAWCCR